MPGPSASEIIKARWCVGIVLKSIAALLFALSITWSATRIPPLRHHLGAAARGFAPSPQVLDIDYFGLPVAFSAGSCLLLLVNRFALHWVVAVPKPLCPGCGYDLSKPTSSQCPECGLKIAEGDSP